VEALRVGGGVGAAPGGSRTFWFRLAGLETGRKGVSISIGVSLSGDSGAGASGTKTGGRMKSGEAGITFATE